MILRAGVFCGDGAIPSKGDAAEAAVVRAAKCTPVAFQSRKSHSAKIPRKVPQPVP